MSVILTISSVGLLVRWLDIFPIEEDWLFCYCLEENETGCTECPTGCLLHKINGMNKCVGPKSSPQVDPILSNDCTGTKPTNSVANNWSTYPISAQWSIYTKRRYAEQPTDETCTYHCKEKYHYYIDWITESCKANACWWSKPDNSTANSSDKPEINNSPWKFQASWTTPCTYHCNDGYEYNSSTKTCDLKEAISECFFCQFRTEKIQNILSWGVWNKLMDELDRLFKVDGAEVTIQTIPSWAIMAFYLTGGCPEWWHDFPQAKGRFLMWTTEPNRIWETWWSNRVMLELNNIPYHQHYMFWPYTMGISSMLPGYDADKETKNTSNRGIVDKTPFDWYISYYANDYSEVFDRDEGEQYAMHTYSEKTSYSRPFPWSEHDEIFEQGVNYNPRNAWIKSDGKNVCNWGCFYYNGWWYYWWWWDEERKNTEPMKWLTSGPKGWVKANANPSEVVITNPYIKVRYCIKD